MAPQQPRPSWLQVARVAAKLTQADRRRSCQPGTQKAIGANNKTQENDVDDRVIYSTRPPDGFESVQVCSL